MIRERCCSCSSCTSTLQRRGVTSPRCSLKSLLWGLLVSTRSPQSSYSHTSLLCRMQERKYKADNSQLHFQPSCCASSLQISIYCQLSLLLAVKDDILQNPCVMNASPCYLLLIISLGHVSYARMHVLENDWLFQSGLLPLHTHGLRGQVGRKKKIDVWQLLEISAAARIAAVQRAERSAFWNAAAVAPFCSRPRPDRGPLHCEPRGRGAALCGLRPGPAPPAPLRAPRRASPSAPHVPACGGPLLLAPPGRSRRCPLAGNGFSRPPSRTLPLLLPLVPSSPGVGVDAASREGSAAPPVRRRSLRTARGALWEDRRAPCPRLAGNGGAARGGRPRLLPAAAAVEPPLPARSLSLPPLRAVLAAVPGERQRSGCLPWFSTAACEGGGGGREEGRRWGRAARGCGQRRCAARGSPGQEGEHRPLGARPQGALGWAGPAALPGIPVSRRGTRSAGSRQALPTYRRSVFSLGVRVQRHLSRVCGRASSEPEKVKTVLKSADSGTQQSLKCRPS